MVQLQKKRLLDRHLSSTTKVHEGRINVEQQDEISKACVLLSLCVNSNNLVRSEKSIDNKGSYYVYEAKYIGQDQQTETIPFVTKCDGDMTFYFRAFDLVKILNL